VSSPQKDPRPPHTILVLEKAISLLGRFDGNRPEWGVTELSKELRINKSTVSKIISTLENHGFLGKNTETRKYRLGLRLFELGSLVAAQLDLQKEALACMEELNKKVEETIHLVVMNDFDIVYINKVEGPGGLRISTRVGGRLPAHCTGVGKILLAALSPEELRLFLKKRPLKKFTSSTITDPEILKQSLDAVREQGYALDNEEFSGGLTCVAAPIKNYSDKIIGAISISGSTHRLREKNLESLISQLKKTAQKVSQRLGSNEGNTRAAA
jgi:IclR family transcriptional regulator, KDG regulon repressor